MTFFSNTSIFTVVSDSLTNTISSPIIEKLQFINFHKFQSTDPIIKLLEDIKTRKIKVVIPTEDDLGRHASIKQSLTVDVNLKNSDFQIAKPVKFPQIFKNQRSPEFPTVNQKLLLEKLKKIPIYVIVTNKNEMVMAMSRDNYENNLFNWIYKKYYDSCVWTEDEGPVSIGLFFMNKEDAQLYLHEITAANPKLAERSELEVRMVGLDTFYRLNRTSPPGQQAKLIADLGEIEKIITDYIPKKKHDVNSRQKYNKHGYRGTPIYLIKPTITKNKRKQLEHIPYQLHNNDEQKYLFFRLQDAYAAWDKFCEENKSINLPLYPTIEMYNLENCLVELERSNPTTIKNFSFISTQESFENLKVENDLKSKKRIIPLPKEIKKRTKEKFKMCQMFLKKVLWVITSDTLPTEKNAW